MNKRRRFKAKRNRRLYKLMNDFRNMMGGKGIKDYYKIKIDIR